MTMTTVTDAEILCAFILCMVGGWVVYKCLKFAHKAFGDLRHLKGTNAGIMNINKWGQT